MVTRREALGAMVYPAALALGARLEGSRVAQAVALAHAAASQDDLPEDVARNEAFWRPIQQAFTVERTFINLNNGGVSPSPTVVQEAMKRHLDYANSCPPPIALWEVLEPQKEIVRQRLARHWGVDPEEIAMTRNSSESLQICQFGFDLSPDDEVLTTTQDYPRMIATFNQRARREGVVLRQLRLPVPCESDDEIVGLFERHITPKTRLILMSHVINLTGQILPVRRVVAMARARDVPVIVDGAHALAQFQFALGELDCDYYAASLHKWLCAPHGTGLLYVRREKINGLWPLMAADEKLDGDIRKFEEIGTHPAANALAVAEALTFHQGIGDARKEARLRFLRDRWARRLLAADDRVKVHTSLDPRFSCAIGTVQIEGVDSTALAKWLRERWNIVTVAIEHDQFQGIRVTPNVYTTLEEIDRFDEAMEMAITRGIGA